MPTLTEIKLSALAEIKKLTTRGIKNSHANVNAHRTDYKEDKSRETLSEREFVRKFGSKVKRVRYSNRADFVGLMVLGDSIGFLVVRDKSGQRKLRIIERSEVDHAVTLTNRYRPLKTEDSLSNLQRGLLAWVQ